MGKKKYTGERLETHELGQGMLEHLHRYGLCLEFCRNKNILDIASGEGYGTHLLSKVAANALGVDISQETVNAATEKYAREKKNLQFQQGSADAIPAEDHRFDVVVSFETIEHHDKHIEMINEIKRVLKPGGLLIISSPDKLYYSDKPGTHNPFHVKELYKEEFRSLLTARFAHVDLYRQKSFYASVLVPDDERSTTQGLSFYEGDYKEVRVNNDMESVYLLALASDQPLQKLQPSLFKDYDFVTNMRKKLESTSRFQFGNMVLNPIQFFKQKFAGKK